MEISMSVEWLERIERKIDAQGKEQRQMAAVLDAHTGMLDTHTSMLDTHTGMLDATSKEVLRIGVRVEKLEDDLRGVAEGVIGLSEQMGRQYEDILARLDARAAPIEAASRRLASKLADHERRLPKRPRRRER